MYSLNRRVETPADTWGGPADWGLGGSDTCSGAFSGSHRRAQNGLSREGCTWKGRQRISDVAGTVSRRKGLQHRTKGLDRAAGVSGRQPGKGTELRGPPELGSDHRGLHENRMQASTEFSEPQMNLVREEFHGAQRKGKKATPEPDQGRAKLGPNWACRLLCSPGELATVFTCFSGQKQNRTLHDTNVL